MKLYCIDQGVRLYHCVCRFHKCTVRTMFCCRVTRSVPFVQQFIPHVNKRVIVYNAVHSAQSVHQINNDSQYWWGDAIGPSCSPQGQRNLHALRNREKECLTEKFVLHRNSSVHGNNFQGCPLYSGGKLVAVVAAYRILVGRPEGKRPLERLRL
jgi:hypothetical protein